MIRPLNPDGTLYTDKQCRQHINRIIVSLRKINYERAKKNNDEPEMNRLGALILSGKKGE